MNRGNRTGQRLVALFALGALLLNYPILSIFARATDLGGIPLLYAYVFAVWAGLIGITALVVERPSG